MATVIPLAEGAIASLNVLTPEDMALLIAEVVAVVSGALGVAELFELQPVTASASMAMKIKIDRLVPIRASCEGRTNSLIYRGLQGGGRNLRQSKGSASRYSRSRWRRFMTSRYRITPKSLSTGLVTGMARKLYR